MCQWMNLSARAFNQHGAQAEPHHSPQQQQQAGQAGAAQRQLIREDHTKTGKGQGTGDPAIEPQPGFIQQPLTKHGGQNGGQPEHDGNKSGRNVPRCNIGAAHGAKHPKGGAGVGDLSLPMQGQRDAQQAQQTQPEEGGDEHAHPTGHDRVNAFATPGNGKWGGRPDQHHGKIGYGNRHWGHLNEKSRSESAAARRTFANDNERSGRRRQLPLYGCSRCRSVSPASSAGDISSPSSPGSTAATGSSLNSSSIGVSTNSSLRGSISEMTCTSGMAGTKCSCASTGIGGTRYWRYRV